MARQPVARALEIAKTIVAGSPLSHQNHQRHTLRALEPEMPSREAIMVS